jgi:hypothetical protein
MATDNSGNLLWRQLLPDAMEECALVALDDGGCLVGTNFSWGENPEYSKEYFYIFRYDKDGNNIKTDSIYLVPIVGNNGTNIGWTNAYKTPSGRIIFYMDCYVYPPGNYNGLVFEYSPESGLAWIRNYYLPVPDLTAQDVTLNGCIETADGGLLFSGRVTDYTTTASPVSPLLMKTTATGDTLWTKRFVADVYWGRNIITAPGGNYRFCFNSGYGYSGSKGITHIYEVNENGDSLNSVLIDDQPQNPCNVIVANRDGGCFALVNNSNYNVISTYTPNFFLQGNSRKLRIDAGLNVVSDSHFQQLTTDFLSLACMTSDGHMACFGIMQPIGKTYYLPHLYILK